MAKTNNKKSGGARKYGRNAKKPCHALYKKREGWNKNKVRRAKKLVRKFGWPVRVKVEGELVTIS